MIAPLVRIALYILTGYLVKSSLISEDVAREITDDPAIVAMVSEVVALAPAAIAVLWWRIAKRMGWAT